MALLTAGTKLTTSLSALVWQPSGMNVTDLAALNALIKSPTANVTNKKSWLQNGRLFVPGERSQLGFQVNPGDYIAVDGAGWPIVIPGQIFSTSWQHS